MADPALVGPGRLTTRTAGESIAVRVAQIAGHVLGWDADRQAAEVATFLDGARREYGIPG